MLQNTLYVFFFYKYKKESYYYWYLLQSEIFSLKSNIAKFFKGTVSINVYLNK